MGLADQLAERLAAKQEETGETTENVAPAQDETPMETGDESSREGESVEENPAEGQEGGSEQTGQAAGEETPISLLTDLAGYLDVDPETLYGLQVKLSDTGDPLTVGELKDKVQEYSRREAEIEESKRQLEEERSRVSQQVQQAQQSATQLSEEGQKAQMDMLLAVAEFERIDWAELEKADPGRAALHKQNLMQRHSEAQTRLRQATTQAQQEQHQTLVRAKQEHDRKLLERVPEWRDSKKAQADVEGIIGWMRDSYGYSDNEIGMTVDWRARDICRKAHAYDQMRAKASHDPKPPLVLKRGVSLPKRDKAKDQLKAKISAAKKGTRADKQAAMRAVLQNAFETR